jgi:hypothetical protein
VLSGGLSFVPEIGSILTGATQVSANILQKADYDLIKRQLKAIGRLGDMTEQIEVAQLVARHLCTRYRSQLLCLKPNAQGKIDTEDLPEESLSSPWWWCCCCEWLCSKQATTSNQNETAEKIATFALAFIIQTIKSEPIKIPSSKDKKQALAMTLIFIVNRAQRGKTSNFFRALFSNKEDKLLIEPSAVLKVARDSIFLTLFQ